MICCARCGHDRDEHKLVLVVDAGTGGLEWPERIHCKYPFCICLQFVWPAHERRVLTNAHA